MPGAVSDHIHDEVQVGAVGGTGTGCFELASASTYLRTKLLVCFRVKMFACGCQKRSLGPMSGVCHPLDAPRTNGIDFGVSPMRLKTSPVMFPNDAESSV
jgi:hypothetical protein